MFPAGLLIHIISILVVNGDAKVQEEDKKADAQNESAPAATQKQPQENFFTKIKKHMSFKNINILKKKKAPKDATEEKNDQEAAPEKVEEPKKEGEIEAEKKVEATSEKSEDKKEVKDEQSSKATEVKQDEIKTDKPSEPSKAPEIKTEEVKTEKPAETTEKQAEVKAEPLKAEEKKVEVVPTEEKKEVPEISDTTAEVKQETPVAEETKSWTAYNNQYLSIKVIAGILILFSSLYKVYFYDVHLSKVMLCDKFK